GRVRAEADDGRLEVVEVRLRVAKLAVLRRADAGERQGVERDDDGALSQEGLELDLLLLAVREGQGEFEVRHRVADVEHGDQRAIPAFCHKPDGDPARAMRPRTHHAPSASATGASTHMTRRMPANVAGVIHAGSAAPESAAFSR